MRLHDFFLFIENGIHRYYDSPAKVENATLSCLNALKRRPSLCVRSRNGNRLQIRRGRGESQNDSSVLHANLLPAMDWTRASFFAVLKLDLLHN